MHAALWLVLSFFSAAGLWLLLQAEFLAIALVLVYVGAVMVLFLFVVMMLDVNFDQLRERFRSYIPVAATVGVLVLVEMALVLLGGYFGEGAPPPAPAGAGYSNTKLLGAQIYTDYAYPFEIAAVVLLVAIIAAIALDASPSARNQVSESGRAGARAAQRPAAHPRYSGRKARRILNARRRAWRRQQGGGRRAVTCRSRRCRITWSSERILFAISVVGIFLNRQERASSC